MNFFYDRQTRRFIQQIIAVFSHFSVEYGKDDDGNQVLRRVPVKYGDPSRMASAIIKENSENKLNTVPIMSVYVTGFDYDRDRVQSPSFVEKKNIRTRKINEATGEMSIHQGNALTVERTMPVPYELKINLDIWTSSTEQKLQLLEQILPLFNPSLEIQSTDNYLDWTSLSYIEIESTNWSSRTIPTGTDDQIDVATLSFRLPIWLSLPAKVKKLNVIKTIIASIYDEGGSLHGDILDTANLLQNRMYITPTNHNLLLLNGVATLLPPNYPVDRGATSTDIPFNPNDAIPWQPLINAYGQLVDGETEIRLRKNNPDFISEVVGTITSVPSDPNKLTFSVDPDTVPQNTMPPVDSIIDPTKVRPGKGLPAAAVGQRYMVIAPINADKLNDDTFDGADAWKSVSGVDFVAGSNDIIMYTGSEWQVAWDSTGITREEFVTNLRTAIQYKWTGDQWQKSYEGIYPAGTWSIVI